jgi:hypothetical protein
MRDAGERGDDPGNLELVPAGKKDWIAGRRISSSVQFGELDEIFRSVLKQLLIPESFQRIRKESIRIYAIRPHLPVFLDALDSDSEKTREPDEGPVSSGREPAEKKESSVTCPICKLETHCYNLQRDPTGRIVGCYMCGGNSGF